MCALYLIKLSICVMLCLRMLPWYFSLKRACRIKRARLSSVWAPFERTVCACYNPEHLHFKCFVLFDWIWQFSLKRIQFFQLISCKNMTKLFARKLTLSWKLSWKHPANLISFLFLFSLSLVTCLTINHDYLKQAQLWSPSNNDTNMTEFW